VESLLVVNQVVGPLARELLEDLDATGVRCAVVAGWVDGRPAARRFEVLGSVPLCKAPVWRRLVTWSAFAVHAWAILARRRRTPSLVVTNPPLTMLALPLLKRLFGLRYVLLVYDIYPDVGERMGLLKPGGLIARLWRRASARAMREAAGVVTLGSHMAETLRGHFRPGEAAPIEVIPNWADTEFIRPRPKADNPFSREHNLAGKFVVMYSGAFGATHDINSILGAAEQVQDLEDVRFVLIGGGTREREVAERAAARNLPNVTILPLQPLDVLPLSLAAADCAIVCLDEGYEGIAVPSKTYPSLAAGSAILAISPPETELTDLVAEERCGIHVLPRRPDDLAQAIRRFHADREYLAACKAASRAAAEERYSRRTLTHRYAEALRRWFGEG